MNNTILYHLVDLDIRAILQEEADQLIKTLNLLETQVTELTNDESEYLLDTHIVEVPTTLESKTQEPKSNRLYEMH